MNNKELVAKIASQTNMQKQETENLLEKTVEIFRQKLGSGQSIGIQGFGVFEVRKKDERLSIHPATKVRTLVPPKLVAGFKQSSILKEKLNRHKQ